MEYYSLKKSEAILVSLKGFIVDGDRLLVLKTLDDDHVNFRHRWGLPGGLLEMNEDIGAGLKREIEEETGLKVDVKEVVAVGDFWHQGFTFKDGRRVKVRIVEIGYRCQYLGGGISLSHEHSSYQWATRAELKKLKITPDSEDLIEAYIKGNPGDIKKRHP